MIKLTLNRQHADFRRWFRQGKRNLWELFHLFTVWTGEENRQADGELALSAWKDLSRSKFFRLDAAGTYPLLAEQVGRTTKADRVFWNYYQLHFIGKKGDSND